MDKKMSAPINSLPTLKKKNYWKAQGLSENALQEFQTAHAQNDRNGQIGAFFLLANYYGRTLSILQAALADKDEPLAQAAMQNLLTLHRPLAIMYRTDPDTIPVTLTLDKEGREDFLRDLLVRVLAESPQPLDLETVVERVNQLDILGTTSERSVRRQLKELISAEYVQKIDDQFARTTYIYTELDLDAGTLRSLLGRHLYEKFAEAGFRGLNEIDIRQAHFRRQFFSLTGFNESSLILFLEVVHTLLTARIPTINPWRHADLITSTYPRPYQYEAYAIFRGNGYQGQLVEAPTGSGKTFIGMMCIQDWLRTLTLGQSILILVPTSNYQQQWIGELCYKPTGLRLSPELVFAGTPAQLQRFQKQTNNHPPLIITTYTALSQIASPIGKGGFDSSSIETILQAANIQYIILDEVHKIAEDTNSISAHITRLFADWLQDGSLRGLIGFTGTGEAYRQRFQTVGLSLTHTIPIDDLIAAGFVAPFAELGVPFSHSARERQIRELLDSYKNSLRHYLDGLGGQRLRSWFTQIPLPERCTLARDWLGMYHGRPDQEEAILKRLTSWEKGEAILFNELELVTILQISYGWTDQQLAEHAGINPTDFTNICQTIATIKEQLIHLIYLPQPVRRLQMPGFATTLNIADIRSADFLALPKAARSARLKDLLAPTIVGLYDTLSEWYMRIGEGRVETIKAVIEAERTIRAIKGVIVFDKGKSIPWRQERSTPGYEGVGGLFAQMLGDQRFTALAALSNEMYLTYHETNPLPPQIAQFIHTTFLQGEIAQAIFDLSIQGLDIPEELRTETHQLFQQLTADYLPKLNHIRTPRLREFDRLVLSPIRRKIRRAQLKTTGERWLARLHRKNIHLAELLRTFYDYAILAEKFRHAKISQLEQVSGAYQNFFVVPMPSNPERKQLMYDLTSRMVDAENLPLNLVIVSNWARTGWNVIKPNLLIDATATRDVTAWQQLRGRAIRALRSWTNNCYRLMGLLLGDRLDEFSQRTDLPEDVARAFEKFTQFSQQNLILDQHLRLLLEEIMPTSLKDKLEQFGLEGLTSLQKQELAIALMEKRNKVTHIYELVKASGSTSQVEYNRPEKLWQRKEAIALKHQYELAVHPFTGEKLAGVAHAPLIYAQDPRHDLPAHLQKTLSQKIKDCDPTIITGWLQE